MMMSISLLTWSDNVAALQQRIDDGLDINMKSQLGWGLLHMATCHLSYRCMRLLLNHGLDPNLLGSNMKQSSLHVAVKYNFLEGVSLLLAAKANPHVRDINGESPLHYALICRMGYSI